MAGNHLCAQMNFLQSKHAYLDQEPPGEKPEVFAQHILSDSGMAIGRIAFSKDGRESFYSFTRHWFDAQNSGTNLISFNGNKWTSPRLIARELSIPTLSMDGKSLYLLDSKGSIWKINKSSGAWGIPSKYLDLPFDLYNFMPTASGNYYVGSNGSWGKKNDYNTYRFSLLTFNKKDTIIKSLGEPLNKQGFNGDFYIAPDERYIIISTNESPDFESDLYISFRKKDSSWTKPISLGPEINNGKAHRFGQYVSPDGKYLFYTSGKDEKDTHIYWLKFDRLLQKLSAEAKNGEP